MPIDGTLGWDYARLGASAGAAPTAEAPRFDSGQGGRHRPAKRQRQGKLGEGELFAFEVLFEPNQDVPAELYADSFKRVSSLAATYGGAVITVEGTATHGLPASAQGRRRAGRCSGARSSRRRI